MFGKLAVYSELAFFPAPIERFRKRDPEIFNILCATVVVAGVIQAVGRHGRRADLKSPAPFH